MEKNLKTLVEINEYLKERTLLLLGKINSGKKDYDIPYLGIYYKDELKVIIYNTLEYVTVDFYNHLPIITDIVEKFNLRQADLD